MICFLGNTLSPNTMREAAKQKGLPVTDIPIEADLVFYSQDTPTDEKGNRDVELIRKAISLLVNLKGILVLTSQVPPGFTRSLNRPIYYQAETLRIKDAMERALNPEMHIVGCLDTGWPLPKTYFEYLEVFNCPIFKMSCEEAEYAKIAINMCLITQVEMSNVLYEKANKIGADWEIIKAVLQQDRRIGPYAYLEPGKWGDSEHLLRDYVTFTEL